MGKSLHIKKLADKLKDKKSYCIVPVHGPVVDFNTVMRLLQPYSPCYESLIPQIIHMDIDSEVYIYIDFNTDIDNSFKYLMVCQITLYILPIVQYDQ